MRCQHCEKTITGKTLWRERPFYWGPFCGRWCRFRWSGLVSEEALISAFGRETTQRILFMQQSDTYVQKNGRFLLHWKKSLIVVSCPREEAPDNTALPCAVWNMSLTVKENT